MAGDPALVRRGYRYYRGFGLDLGGFLTRRFTLEDGRGASVTLVAGIDIESGAGMLEHCTSTAQAARELTSGPASIWAIVLTLENATISWRELSRHLMVSDPSAFGGNPSARLRRRPRAGLPAAPGAAARHRSAGRACAGPAPAWANRAAGRERLRWR